MLSIITRFINTLATPTLEAIRLYLPSLPSAAQHLLNFIMDAAAEFARQQPNGVHGEIPMNSPKRNDESQCLYVCRPTLPPSKLVTLLTSYVRSLHSLVEAYGHSATVSSNQSDPRGKHGIIYTTPCPPSPLVDEKKLYGAVFATKFNYFLDLPPTARVNYKSLFMVRHDAEVFPVARLDADNLTALCLNYEDVTGGQKLRIEFPRPPEDPNAPPAYNSLFPVSENEVD
ncbi:hypothetical protein BKA80DRAFT_257460 [Phyllosticta citrichinensis]